MRILFYMAMLLGFAHPVSAQRLSLAGTWQVQLDAIPGPERPVKLPGTLDDAGIGQPVRVDTGLNLVTMAHLTRKVQYIGKARYTTTFTVPATWQQKQVTLVLGRVIWKSAVTIDGRPVPGEGESLVTAHRFNVTDYLLPGKQQTLTIEIDNSDCYPGINIEERKYPVKENREMVHAYTNHTQIKWNGILGEITLEARPAAHLAQVTVNPDLQQQEIRVQCTVTNSADRPARLSAFVTEKRTGKRWPVVINRQTVAGDTLLLRIPFAPQITPWNEFSPVVYQLTTVLESGGQRDTGRTDFGIRLLGVREGNLQLNGQRIFIRGNLECVIFPTTGYPPMKEQEWADLFAKAKSFGLNSFRFHSWCPPEAAFAAADAIGFYLQVELPHWNLNVGKDTAAFSFLEREAYRILAAYGNHPSFLFFSMGNELQGRFDKLNTLVAALKKKDDRHLYSTTTFTFQQGITGAPQPQDDYFVTQWTQKGWIRGQGIFNDKTPDFSTDYTTGAAGLSVPLISHEIGQYSVYPDVKEIALYKGNLAPVNFIAVKKELQQKGLLPLAQDYLLASGKFAALLYKEEIERALKTREFDGFQLLQLQDFPGQGTALVGLLNAFWQSKGVITPAAFSRYCSPVTPLLRFDKAVYTNDEPFTAKVELANFRQPFTRTSIVYHIKDAAGTVLKTGSFPARNYGVDNGLAVGTITFPLQGIATAKKLTITVAVAGTPYSNSWNIWVYPGQLPEQPAAVVVTTSREEAIRALNDGRKVLLCPAPDTLKGAAGKFVPVFWSPVHFPDQPGTMGLLIKASHPALKDFPTDTHSNWQWWDLAKKSRTLPMGTMPDAANLVRPIDNFVTNENLSSLFEARLGKGQLVFCAMDITTDLPNRPQARQLRYSLMRYMAGNQFNPSWIMNTRQLEGLFR